MAHGPSALVITAAGINCDVELVHAFEAAGARVESIHLERLRREPSLVDRFQLIGLPGGFSYGDDVAAGRVMAVLIRRSIYPALAAAVDRGVPIIAPCNGFQIAVQCGLLPGPDAGVPWPTVAPQPRVALARNERDRFEDRWTGYEIPADTRCVWTRGLATDPEIALVPSAHGEGRFVADDATIEALARDGRIAMRYPAGENFNGSTGRVAGICDASGLVLGLMPHPERYTRWTQHPQWTRLAPAKRTGDPPGLAIFRNAIAVASELPV